VVRDESPQVDAGQHVAVEDQDRVIGSAAQPGGDVADPPAGAERFDLGDVLEVQPEGRTVAEVLLEDLRLVGGGEHDMVDTGVAGPGELMRGERHAGGRQHRLGR
jgi:hypothetical protein